MPAAPPTSPALTLLLAAAAFLAGLVDAIAGGGGLISLPALLAAGLPPAAALATNKGQAIFGAVSSFASFWRRRGIDRARAPLGFVAGFVGSCLGVRALLAMRPEPLRPVVMALLIGAAVIVLGSPKRAGTTPAPVAEAAPGGRGSARASLALAAIALVLGAYDGFFGPGTGSMLIVAFTLVFGQSLTRASGNAKVVNLASNLAAFLLFAWRGTILWRIALPMAAANAIGASVGAHLALRRGDRLVRWVVLVVVSAVVVKLAVDFARAP
jgi:uncharacterized membrane protein YfcA